MVERSGSAEEGAACGPVLAGCWLANFGRGGSWCSGAWTAAWLRALGAAASGAPGPDGVFRGNRARLARRSRLGGRGGFQAGHSGSPG